jgi:hypothetical protein
VSKVSSPVTFWLYQPGSLKPIEKLEQLETILSIAEASAGASDVKFIIPNVAA